MVSQDHGRFREIRITTAFLHMQAALGVAMAAAFAIVLIAAPATATTYTVDTLDNSSGNGDCSLRDAINAANGTPTSGSTCTTAGTGSDTIQFSVTGTILLNPCTNFSCTSPTLAVRPPAFPESPGVESEIDA